MVASRRTDADAVIDDDLAHKNQPSGRIINNARTAGGTTIGQISLGSFGHLSGGLIGIPGRCRELISTLEAFAQAWAGGRTPRQIMKAPADGIEMAPGGAKREMFFVGVWSAPGHDEARDRRADVDHGERVDDQQTAAGPWCQSAHSRPWVKAGTPSRPRAGPAPASARLRTAPLHVSTGPGGLSTPVHPRRVGRRWMPTRRCWTRRRGRTAARLLAVRRAPTPRGARSVPPATAPRLKHRWRWGELRQR